jgi:cytochrome c5
MFLRLGGPESGDPTMRIAAGEQPRPLVKWIRSGGLGRTRGPRYRPAVAGREPVRKRGVGATAVVTGVAPEPRTAAQVGREFRALLAGGMRLRTAGAARLDPEGFVRRYLPKQAIALFGARFFLAHLREDANFRFFVAYVEPAGARRSGLYPRLFYKDSSLVWRCATHYIDSESDNWIGKGDLKWVEEGDGYTLYSAEETTNLPLEMQAALDLASRAAPQVRRDERALGLVLRKAPDGRVSPYRDFSEPRRRAASDRRQRIHGGKPIAWFARPGDPESLRFERGYAPDFGGGVIETSESKSRLYGGDVRKLRILSQNRRIQYQFLAAPRLVWIIPPQTLTTELTTYGVRTLDVEVAEDLCVPGYEYHYPDDDAPGGLYSQIPAGFAGAQSEVDPARADAAPWLERLPVIREFRKKLGIAAALLAALVCAPAGARAQQLDARLAQVYTQVCATCHQRPETGAPLTGDPAAWREAASQGRDAMLAHSVTGIRGMPPLGTCGFCSEDDLRRLIDFMAPAGDAK